MNDTAATSFSSFSSAVVAAPGVLRLEQLLNDVLKHSLDELLSQRDELYTRIAQCTQLRQLFQDMKALSRYHSTVPAMSQDPAAASSSHIEADTRNKDSKAHDASHEDRNNIRASHGAASSAPQSNRLLVDLGCHFYSPGVVRDATRVHVNLGCNVVLQMSVPEAEMFVQKKERLLRGRALALSKEALRLKYRIRLVTEAIARLQDQHLGLMGGGSV